MKYIFQTHTGDNTYIPGLHINSESEPDLASNTLGMRMNEFEKEMRRKKAKYNRQVHPAKSNRNASQVD